MYPVSSVKERNRKGGKCKISQVLHLPVSSPQASQKVLLIERFQTETPESIRACLVPGEWVLSIDLSDAYQGIGVVLTLVQCVPSHPHKPKLKEVPKVLPTQTNKMCAVLWKTMTCYHHYQIIKKQTHPGLSEHDS